MISEFGFLGNYLPKVFGRSEASKLSTKGRDASKLQTCIPTQTKGD
jgi:hypothetical protein